MIPYFQFTSFSFGPFTIYVWGLFAALGFLVAFWIADRELKRRHIFPERTPTAVGGSRRATGSSLVWDAAPWIVLSAMLGSRLYAVFIDYPDYYFAHPSEIINISSGGLSVFGGIIAATLTGLWYLKRRGALRWEVVESFVFALPFGIGIGRIGCFLIHDHPGTLTSMLWGVQYPDGVRHDLALELGIFDFVLFGVFLFFRRRNVRTGFYVFSFLVAKSLIRLWLDFYRIWDGPLAEPRYGTLTATQIVASITLCAVAIFFLYRVRQRRGRIPPPSFP